MQLIAALGISKAEFERVCGLSNGYINSIRNTIGSKGIVKILEQFPQVNKAWLVLGEGNMFVGDKSPTNQNQSIVDVRGYGVTVGGNASNVSNGTTDEPIIKALTEISEMRKLLSEVIYINKEQSQRLITIVDKMADKM